MIRVDSAERPHLPRRRQQLVRLIKSRDITRKDFAKLAGLDPSRLNNLITGNTFPRPEEIKALESFFGLPVETMFEPDMLAYRHSGPPKAGARPGVNYRAKREAE